MGSNVSVVGSNGGVFDLIKAINRGDFVLDLEDAVKEVVANVIERGGMGKVTLDFKFQIDPQTNAMKVFADLKKTSPKKAAKATLFFVTPDGELTRTSPQREMFPGAVDV